MAVHPLRPATHHRLGEPLPHQLTNGTQSSLTAHIAFITRSCDPIIISGISIRFQMLSQSVRQVLYALLTRPPPSPEGSSRLACVKHSVSVHPEPGSNSSLFKLFYVLAPESVIVVQSHTSLTVSIRKINFPNTCTTC